MWNWVVSDEKWPILSIAGCNLMVSSPNLVISSEKTPIWRFFCEKMQFSVICGVKVPIGMYQIGS